MSLLNLPLAFLGLFSFKFGGGFNVVGFFFHFPMNIKAFLRNQLVHFHFELEKLRQKCGWYFAQNHKMHR